MERSCRQLLRDFEERLVQNPLLGASLLWEFTRKYETHGNVAQGASLLVLIPVLPLLLHRASAEKLRGMQFDSGLAKLLIEFPTIRFDLQRRIAAFSALSLSSLNLACAAGLLRRMPLVAAPVFMTMATKLPPQVIAKGTPAVMKLAARRLGAFFRDETLFQIEAKLGIIL